jgi:ribosome-associated translation inhibitor RaiA
MRAMINQPVKRMPMTVKFRQLAQRTDPALAAHVRDRLTALQGVIAIDSAEVTLRKTVSHPPFTATAYLEVPGPNLHAEVHGYTQQAALNRMFSVLAEQARARKAKRPAGRKGRALRPGGPTRTVTSR